MTLSPNQFVQSVVKGQQDLQLGGANVVSGVVYGSEATALVAGQAVKVVDSATAVPTFTACSADTDVPAGFVCYNFKNPEFAAGQTVEVAMVGTVMYMEAGAAIARFANVEVDVSEKKVITAAGVNPVAGFAYDKAAADGDLIRVWIQRPIPVPQTIADISGLQAALDASLKVAVVTATLAEINAGKTLIAGVSGKAITVTNIAARVAGNFASGTAVLVQSSNGTPVIVDTLAEAALTTGAVLIPGSANTTLGAGFGVALGSSDGLVVANSGSAQTGGTSIVFTVTYRQA